MTIMMFWASSDNFPFVEKLQNPLGTKGRTSIHSLATMYRALCEASSLTAESRRPRGFVASRPQGGYTPLRR